MNRPAPACGNCRFYHNFNNGDPNCPGECRLEPTPVGSIEAYWCGKHQYRRDIPETEYEKDMQTIARWAASLDGMWTAEGINTVALVQKYFPRPTKRESRV